MIAVIGAKLRRLTQAEWEELCELSYGFCLNCGAERECTEPDAEGYDCPECGENDVCGAEQDLLSPAHNQI